MVRLSAKGQEEWTGRRRERERGSRTGFNELLEQVMNEGRGAKSHLNGETKPHVWEEGEGGERNGVAPKW